MDALKGSIAVANIFENDGHPGSVSVCTMSAGCTVNLTNSNMYELAGVVMDNKGNCWASATNLAGSATLTYFASCKGAGLAATGFKNNYYGGLDIDKNDNLVSISAFDAALYVYKGCNPSCILVGGPFPLHSQSIYGHLNKQSMTLCVGDIEYGQMDVFYYSPRALTYWYSFNNGLSASELTEACAYNPRGP